MWDTLAILKAFINSTTLCPTPCASFKIEEGGGNEKHGGSEKDTVGALEDDTALNHLSHDAPHWPYVHWKTQNEFIWAKHHTPQKNILHGRQRWTTTSVVQIRTIRDACRASSCYFGRPWAVAPRPTALITSIFRLAFFPLWLWSQTAFQGLSLASAAWLINLHSCCFLHHFPSTRAQWKRM